MFPTGQRSHGRHSTRRLHGDLPSVDHRLTAVCSPPMRSNGFLCVRFAGIKLQRPDCPCPVGFNFSVGPRIRSVPPVALASSRKWRLQIPPGFKTSGRWLLHSSVRAKQVNFSGSNAQAWARPFACPPCSTSKSSHPRSAAAGSKPGNAPPGPPQSARSRPADDEGRTVKNSCQTREAHDCPPTRYARGKLPSTTDKSFAHSKFGRAPTPDGTPRNNGFLYLLPFTILGPEFCATAKRGRLESLQPAAQWQ